MKNLKKVFALVLALSMILSTFTALTLTASAAAPAFSDIEGTSYAEAVEVLSALGIVAGYEDGTYGGDKIVTRAEMAAFIVRELGLAATASSSTGGAQFTDVPANHWAAGSIDVATRKKIIVGNGDGTFAPDATVTYEAAVKMLVCALGYDIVAQKQGGWPTGYLIQGAALGLTAGIDGIDGSSDCNRGIVATLLYNALEVSVMEEVMYTGGVSTSEPTQKTFLGTNLNVTRYYDVEILGTASQGNKTREGMARFNGYYDVVNPYDYTSKVKATTDPVTVYAQVGETDPEAVYGSKVVVYVKKNGANVEPTMLCILGDTASQETVELKVADFYGSKSVIFPGEENTEGKNTSKYLAKLYYKTEEDTKVQYIKLLDTGAYDSQCKVIVNGVEKDLADWAILDTLENGTVKFVDALAFDYSTGTSKPGVDGIFEKAVIDTYFDFIVSEVDLDEGIISTHDGEDITLDESKIYTLKDVEGNEVKLEDLQENDVLSVYCDAESKNKVDASEVINIVVYNAPIEGTVTEITAKALYIDGTKYTLAGTEVALDDFNLEDAGIFYLNAAGEIVFADTTAASKDYVVIYDALQNGAKTIEVSAKSSEGSELALEINSTFDAIWYTSDGTRYVKNEKEYKLRSEMAEAVELVEPFTAEGAYAPYVATLTLADDGKTIDKIYFPGVVSGNEEKFATRFAIWADGIDASYNKNESTFGPYVVDSSSVIFDIPVSVAGPEDAKKLIKVINKDGLKTNTKYENVTVYEVDKNSVAKSLLIRSTEGSIDWNKDMAVIQGITTVKNADGDNVYKLYMIQGGRLITKTTYDAAVIEDYGTGTLADGYTQYSLDIAYSFYPGAVIMFNEDASGAIDNVIKTYPATSFTGLKTDEVPYYRSEYFTSFNGDYKFGYEACDSFVIYGKVKDKNTSTKIITVETNILKDNVVTPYTYTAKYEGANVVVVNYAFEEDAERVAVGTASDIKKDSYVLIRKNDGATKDIVVYDASFNPDEYVF